MQISGCFGQTLLQKSWKTINSCCRHAVGSWDLSADGVKWGLCLFMCDRVSHLLLPFNRIRRRTGRWLLVCGPPHPPVEPILALSQDVWPLQSLGLKHNLELCTANHTGSPGNNTPRYCAVGRGRRGKHDKVDGTNCNGYMQDFDNFRMER